MVGAPPGLAPDDCRQESGKVELCTLGSRFSKMRSPEANHSRSKSLSHILELIGASLILLSLTANQIGLGHNPGWGWKKILLLLIGLPSFVAGVAYAKAGPKLLAAAFAYGGVLMIGLAVAAHRLHLGHNPELRWTKALLFIAGLAFTAVGVGVLYAQRSAHQLYRFAFAYFGIVSIGVALTVYPLGLAQDPGFRWKRISLMLFGLLMSGLAGLSDRLGVHKWIPTCLYRLSGATEALVRTVVQEYPKPFADRPLRKGDGARLFAPSRTTISGEPNTSRYSIVYALLLWLCLSIVYVALIVKIDNTNLQTTNGLWKTPAVYNWEHKISAPVDTGGFLYFPTYGYLSRLIPDALVSYGAHGDVVTYRKLAILNALFGAFASGMVFLLALRITGSIAVSLLVFLAHASSAFVLLNSLNSEDVIPAYAFFVVTTVLALEYWITRRLLFLILAAPFLALVTLFHWTLMIPGAAAIASAQIYDMVRHKTRPWPGAAFVLIFVGVIKVCLVMISARTSQVFTVWQTIYPSKASGAGGWVGLRWEKVPYALVGMGNYFSGGANVGDYHSFLSAYPKTMLFSYIYFIPTGLACVWALWSGSVKSRVKQMALFGVTLFFIGELEHFYSQPQDPQSQIQPMFITVIGLTILLCLLINSKAAGAFRWVGVGLLALFALNGAVNLRAMLLTQGADSQSVRAVEQFAQLFSPNNTVIVTQGFEGFNTWLDVELYHGDNEQYLSRDIELANAFTTHAGITGSEAANLTKKRIDKALDDGYRVVADAIWTGEPTRFVGSLEEVTNSRQATAYYECLKPAFDIGQSWDTPYGRFVELRSRAKHLP
jgi:hypothetical protein